MRLSAHLGALKTPWIGDSWGIIHGAKRKAKQYQVRQVLSAIDKLIYWPLFLPAQNGFPPLSPSRLTRNVGSSPL